VSCCSIACVVPTDHLLPCISPTQSQGRLLLLATELLPLGSLREALQQRELRRELRWSTG